MLAALYALGLSPQDLERVVTEPDVTRLWRSALDPGWYRGGLIRGERFERYINERYFHGATFADLSLPLKIACTDIDTGELILLTSGSLARAVRASSAFPLMVAPAVVGGRLLVDGGLVATVPVAALNEPWIDLKIGVHAGVNVERSRFVAVLRRHYASPRAKALRQWLLSVPRSRLGRTLAGGLVRVVGSYAQRVEAPPGVFFIATCPDISWWGFGRADEAVQAGRRAAEAALAGDLGTAVGHAGAPAQ